MLFFLDYYFLWSQTVLLVRPRVLIVAGLFCFSCRFDGGDADADEDDWREADEDFSRRLEGLLLI